MVHRKVVTWRMIVTPFKLFSLAPSVEVSNCTHGSMRLTGTTQPSSGRVEICIHGVWGTVCDDGWDSRDANVVCGQVGYFSFGKCAY